MDLCLGIFQLRILPYVSIYFMSGPFTGLPWHQGTYSKLTLYNPHHSCFPIPLSALILWNCPNKTWPPYGLEFHPCTDAHSNRCCSCSILEWDFHLLRIGGFWSFKKDRRTNSKSEVLTLKMFKYSTVENNLSGHAMSQHPWWSVN